MDTATKRRVRDEMSVMIFRCTTAIQVSVFELTDESTDARSVLRGLMEAQNNLNEAISAIRRTL